MCFAVQECMCVFMYDACVFAGSLIPNNCVAPLIHTLSQDSAKTYTEKHHQSLQSAVNGLKASNALSSLASHSNRASGTPGGAIKVETGSESSKASRSSSSSKPAEPVLSMPTFDF